MVRNSFNLPFGMGGQPPPVRQNTGWKKDVLIYAVALNPAAADYFFESMSPDFLMARSSCQPR
jgi:hypothetical protein